MKSPPSPFPKPYLHEPGLDLAMNAKKLNYGENRERLMTMTLAVRF
jgi:hypothetical protein